MRGRLSSPCAHAKVLLTQPTSECKRKRLSLRKLCQITADSEVGVM